MNILLRLLVVLMMGSAYAQSNLPACQGSETSGWSNCTGTKTFANGNKYVGEFKDGKYNGQGTYTFANGDKYVGEWKDGKNNGQGTYTYANGDKYVGEWKDGKNNGQGTYFSLADNKFKGDKYVGEYKDGKNNGQGTYTFADGAKYVGEYKDDKRNGQGTFTYANGDKYVGEWKDDKRNGQGTYTFADGAKYVGEYKDDKRNGQGTFYASNGSIINQGIWADNIFVRSAPVQQAIVPSVQQSNTPNPEIERLRAEAEEAKRKQADLEQQLRLAQQASPVSQSTQSSIPAGKVALVIGNSAYNSRPLDNPVNDARAISTKLRSLGFTVINKENLKIREIGSTLREFRSKISAGDEVLFFYAGHGLQVNGINYLPVVDADIQGEEDVPLNSLSLNVVLSTMEESKAGVKLLFLDACRDNPFARSFRSSAGGDLGKIGSAPSGTLIHYATRPGSVAADGKKGGNGLYTEHLLKWLDVPNTPIEAMHKKVAMGVEQDSKGKQEP